MLIFNELEHFQPNLNMFNPLVKEAELNLTHI